jgi:hypothetical protein
MTKIHTVEIGLAYWVLFTLVTVWCWFKLNGIERS